MRFTTGDWLWDISVYGTAVVLLSFCWTAAEAGNALFAGLCFIALIAELYVTWRTYVPMLWDSELVSKDGELIIEDPGGNHDQAIYNQAMQALEQRHREFMANKKASKSEAWLEIRGK